MSVPSQKNVVLLEKFNSFSIECLNMIYLEQLNSSLWNWIWIAWYRHFFANAPSLETPAKYLLPYTYRLEWREASTAELLSAKNCFYAGKWEVSHALKKPRTWDSEVDFTKSQIARHFWAIYRKFQTLLLKTTSTTLIRPNGRCKAGSKAETSPKGKLFDSQHTVEGYSYVLTYFVSDGFGRS